MCWKVSLALMLKTAYEMEHRPPAPQEQSCRVAPELQIMLVASPTTIQILRNQSKGAGRLSVVTWQQSLGDSSQSPSGGRHLACWITREQWFE